MTRLIDPRTLLLVGIVLIMLIGMSSAQEPKLGDVADGNRSIPVHVLDLYDEEGAVIRATDRLTMPFSLKKTCEQNCHNYTKISGGWHFNSTDSTVPPGRRGEPWILADPVSATQVPLSHRTWNGTFKPESFGLTPFLFTEKFGRHLPGGGVSANDSTESPDIYMRWMVSGKAEINCLSCHDAEKAHDQAEYYRQMQFQNFRWAAAATSGFALVKGSAKNMPGNYDIYSGAIPDIKDAVPPSIEYDKTRFNSKGKVFFDIARKVPKERCYFCHSSKAIHENQKDRWEVDEDVHLSAGMTCIDCHRNGLDHSMSRGYEWETVTAGKASVATLSCKGCHLRNEQSSNPHHGRLGAPYPSHRGIPTIHFEKLSCTACHSGPWPAKTAQKVKLSKSHALGVQGTKKENDVVPYILSPVYVKDEDGKIAPHRLIWPAYWAFMNGDSINPVDLKDIQKIVIAVIKKDSLTDSIKFAQMIAGNWPQFAEKQIIQILDSLKTAYLGHGNPVYICGGKLLSMTGSTHLSIQEHPAAKPYTWAFAHDVRPKEQSLGVKGCEDCHSIDAAFSFGSVKAPVPFDFSEGSKIVMTSFQGFDSVYPRVFALSFLFRPFLKNIILVCCIIIFLVLIVCLLKGLEVILKMWSAKIFEDTSNNV